MLTNTEHTYLIALVTITILLVLLSLYLNQRKRKEKYERVINQRIYILYTGGVMGMVQTPEGLVSQPEIIQKKLDELVSRGKKKIGSYDIDIMNPLIDSSDMNCNDWLNIASRINNVYTQYDAFLIIHGVDTLAYTSSALAFMLENLEKPVVVTGSIVNLEDKRNDGRNNLFTSMDYLSRFPVPEVVVVFNNKITRGCRTTLWNATSSDVFSSPNFLPLGKIGVSIEMDKNRVGTGIDYNQFEGMRLRPFNPRHRVIVIKLFPGIDDYYLYSIVKNLPVHGIVLETFGLGNAPTNPKFLAAIHNMTALKGIVIVNVSQCPINKIGKDNLGRHLEEQGVTRGFDMTTEAAVAKVYHLLSTTKPEQARNLLNVSMRGEITNNDMIDPNIL